jgi:chromosome segregation ATPase
MVVEVEKLEERLREIEAERAEIKEKMLQVEKDAEELSGQKNQAVKDLERAHEERDAIKSELSAAQARIRELEALSGGAEPSAATANPPDAGPTPTPHS